MKTKITWLIRAERNRTHKDLGRTIAGRVDESADDGKLHFEMKTSDGTWTIWDCGDMKRAAAKAIVLDFLLEGWQVFLYRQSGDSMPVRYEDADIQSARESIAPQLPTKPLGKTAAMKDAEKRLKQLVAKR